MPIDPADITPELDQIASFIRVRLFDSNGRQEETFTTDTRPTVIEAQVFALRAARYISLRLGDVGTRWTGDLTSMATDVAALYAALQIETGFYSDGTSPEQNLGDQLGRLVREQVDALVQTAQDNQPGGSPFKSIRQTTATSS